MSEGILSEAEFQRVHVWYHVRGKRERACAVLCTWQCALKLVAAKMCACACACTQVCVHWYKRVRRLVCIPFPYCALSCLFVFLCGIPKTEGESFTRLYLRL